MKSIATINFKGGVGKTTITWLLAKYAAEREGKKVLVIDTDAQMSLTLAVQLQESGLMYGEFEDWYENSHMARKKTLLNALEKYEHSDRGHFDFPIDRAFVYEMSPNLHFVPSVVELYWLELGVINLEAVKNFTRALLGKIEHSTKFNYDYVFFDCPPNFTALSYSVLSCCSLILIPVNPDVFAPRGIKIMIEGLKFRIQPWPNPKIGVFMNKAKITTRTKALTRETSRYLTEARSVCNGMRGEGVNVTCFESCILDRVNIKRAIPGRSFPIEFADDFGALWSNLESQLK